jgi:hypothetical protein
MQGEEDEDAQATLPAVDALRPSDPRRAATAVAAADVHLEAADVATGGGGGGGGPRFSGFAGCVKAQLEWLPLEWTFLARAGALLLLLPRLRYLSCVFVRLLLQVRQFRGVLCSELATWRHPTARHCVHRSFARLGGRSSGIRCVCCTRATALATGHS